ncbi:reverse transcriptase family protein [Colwelliaceae bacterium BS250]
MAIGPDHTYINEGIYKNFPEDKLAEIIDKANKLKRKSLPYVHSIKHLSHYSGSDYNFLRKSVNRFTINYKEYQIPKRSGGFRYIKAPSDELKKVQRWISQNILIKLKPHWRCYSYHKGASIFECATQHCGARWLIKLDLEDFFNSITEIQIYNLFRELGYSSLVSFEFARLCTDSAKVTNEFANKFKSSSKNEDYPYLNGNIKFIGQLPQGAPTSPSLSNMVFKPVDIALEQLAKEFNLVYTRYSDDLCFSTREKSFNREKARKVITLIESLLDDNKYTSNKRKIRVIPPGTSKTVLGLNVSGNVPLLSKVFKSRLERHLYGLMENGPEKHKEHTKFKTIFGLLDHIEGIINYALSIDRIYGEKKSDEFNNVKNHHDLTLFDKNINIIK